MLEDELECPVNTMVVKSHFFLRDMPKHLTDRRSAKYLFTHLYMSGGGVKTKEAEVARCMRTMKVMADFANKIAQCWVDCASHVNKTFALSTGVCKAMWIKYIT